LDSCELEDAADSASDADTDALYTGPSPALTVGFPSVTELHPTTIMARTAWQPTTGATIRSCSDPVIPPIRTVSRRYRFDRRLGGSLH
jgi:hypothetical protein